jgi:hypothetical protein
MPNRLRSDDRLGLSFRLSSISFRSFCFPGQLSLNYQLKERGGSWDSIYLPATAGRLSSSAVSSLCCVRLRHYWLAQTGCPLCGFSSSMRREELSGRQCSELADMYLEKVFVESLDHLDGRCLLGQSSLPSSFGATTRKMRNDSWTRPRQQRQMMPKGSTVSAREVAGCYNGRNTAPPLRTGSRAAFPTALAPPPVFLGQPPTSADAKAGGPGPFAVHLALMRLPSMNSL